MRDSEAIDRSRWFDSEQVIEFREKAGCLSYVSGSNDAAGAAIEEIINALKPPRITRNLTTSPADAARKAEEARFVDGLRNWLTRSLTTAEREQIVTIAEKRPSIDLEVNFEYNSDKIRRSRSSVKRSRAPS